MFDYSQLRIVYIVTGNGDDVHAKMAVVSSMSARISNPGARIVWVCDNETYVELSKKRANLAGIFDELIEVQTPKGSGVFRNRWVKSRLGTIIKGALLYVDSDILIRKSLAQLAESISGIGGVANHNQDTIERQIWSEDKKVLVAMNWPQTFTPAYVNGGLIFSDGTDHSLGFWNVWSSLYDACVETTGVTRDQPSLNSALAQSGVTLNQLPNQYNVQVTVAPTFLAYDAFAWHFYSSEQENAGTVFSRLLRNVDRLSMVQLETQVANTINNRIPWTVESPQHVETSLLAAYRSGRKLRFQELQLLMLARPTLKNCVYSGCIAAGVSNESFEAIRKRIFRR